VTGVTSRLAVSAGFASLLAIALWAYRPGLPGGFLFDDFANLNALGATGAIDNWPAFWRYITSGTADPTGRPIALLSFLIDANNWPADPYPFKRTNLLLHLINATLLGLAFWRLGHRLRPAPSQQMPVIFAALLGAGIWALHPLMVSTTLYIVQREAMLPTTFVMLALHGWISGRSAFTRGATIQGTSWLVLSIGLGTLLATLSKANGILLPLLIGCIDVLILSQATTLPAPSPRARRTLAILRIVLLGIPSAGIAAYLLAQIPHVVEVTPNFRPWTWAQRMLTEPRILLEYLGLLLVPRPFTPGLYNDNVIVATGWLTPWSTLPSILIVLCLPVVAWRIHKRSPIIAAAIAFFLAGHLLESSVIPLELYYEHRNYMPSMLLFWPLAWWLTGTESRQRTARLALGALILGALAWMTHARSTLWGNEREQALVWAALNPDSPRAQATAALHEIHMGRPDLAHQRLAALEYKMSDEPQIAFNRIGASCRMGALLPGDLEAAKQAILESRHARDLTYKWMNDMLGVAINGRCRGFSLAEMETLLTMVKANARLMGHPGRRQELLNIEARIAMAHNDADQALELFNAALDAQVRPAAALEQAATLGKAGYPLHGLRHLEHFDQVKHQSTQSQKGMARIHERLLESQGYWTHEIQVLRQTLATDSTTMQNIRSDSSEPN
jgi:hypothetical protein